MNAKNVILTVGLFILMICPTLMAEFTVSEVSLSAKSWGDQTAIFSIANTGEEYETVVAFSDASFIGGMLNPQRYEKKVVLVPPGESVDVDLPVNIAGEYGDCLVRVRLFDVIDTLDQLLSTQQFHDDSTSFRIEIPDKLMKLLGENIHVPAFVATHSRFDNSFSRIMSYLLYLGKTTDEIAELSGAAPEYVEKTSKWMEDEGYVRKTDQNIRPNFLIVNSKLAQKARPAIDKAISDLTVLITKNLPAYDDRIKELVARNIVTASPENLVDPSSVLHHKYPVVFGLFIWNYLGTEFVTKGEPFDILKDSDPCQAMMGEYMYLVNAGEKDYSPGFYYAVDGAKERFYCGISPLPVQCAAKTDKDDNKEHKHRAPWSFDRSHPPVFYTYSNISVQEPLGVLSKGCEKVISDLRPQIDMVFNTDNQGAFLNAARYWCWNIIAQEVIQKLMDDGVVEIEGEGNLSFTIPRTKK